MSMGYRYPQAIAVVALVILSAGCASNMVYFPTRQVYGNPSASGLGYEDVAFRSRDGTMLSGWFVHARGKAKGTVLHFHGNAQNMTAHFSFVSWLPDAGFNVFVFDYRGYGASAGRPTREGVHEDSCAALDYLRSRRDIRTDRILILGQSLGGANALAAVYDRGKDGIRAVAIDSTFYSYRLIAEDKIKHIPLLGLLRGPLSSVVMSDARSPASVIDKLSPIPILIVHGTEDAVIPYRHGPMLFEKAQHPKRFISVPMGRHTDAFVRSDPWYREQLVEFFEDALQGNPSGKSRQ